MMNREIIHRSRLRALLSVALGSLLLLVISLTIVQAQGADEDGVLHQRGATLEGKYDIVVNGAGLDGQSSNSLPLTVPGTRIVAAYLYWSGIQLENSADDPNVMLQVDLAAPVPVTATTIYGPSFWYKDVVTDKNFFHNTYVADVTDIVTDTVALGAHTYTFSGYEVDTDPESATYGFSLLVVYENLLFSPSEITLLDGLDSVYYDFPLPPEMAFRHLIV